jgi:hypothetical protein
MIGSDSDTDSDRSHGGFMKESHVRRHLDFICFVQETEGYRMTDKAETIGPGCA